MWQLEAWNKSSDATEHGSEPSAAPATARDPSSMMDGLDSNAGRTDAWTAKHRVVSSTQNLNRIHPVEVNSL